MSCIIQLCVSLQFRQHTWDANNPTQTFGTHTTPIARYVDDFDFTFEEQNDGSCSIKVSSIHTITT